MNKTVRTPCYPASKLPTDLRGDIAASAQVRVVVEEIDHPPAPSAENIRAMRDQTSQTADDSNERTGALRDEWDRAASPPRTGYMKASVGLTKGRKSLEELLAELPEPGHHSQKDGVTLEEAVKRIRALRDEWDD